jgi:hypothetical protein
MLNFLHYTPILTGPIVFMTVRPSHAGGRNDTHGVTKSFFATVLPTTLLQYTTNMLVDCAINLSSSKTSSIRNFLRTRCDTAQFGTQLHAFQINALLSASL